MRSSARRKLRPRVRLPSNILVGYLYIDTYCVSHELGGEKESDALANALSENGRLRARLARLEALEDAASPAEGTPPQ